MKDKTVAVIYSNLSTEAKVSNLAANKVISSLEKHYENVISLQLNRNLPTELLKQSVDVAFPVAYGTYGEDGRLQGLLDIMGIPYVGSGTLASACALNKVVSKRILRESGIPMARDRVVCRTENLSTAALDCMESIGEKVIIKPISQGSGIGIQFAIGHEELMYKLKIGLQLDEKILVEEFITGREITVGVLQLDTIEVLPVIEVITPENHWYDYTARYTPGLSDHIIPALLPPHQYKKVQNIALKAHLQLGCQDISRSDFIVPIKNDPIFTELNNLPGMTPNSLFPDSAKHAGIIFEELMCKLIDHALKRGKILEANANART